MTESLRPKSQNNAKFSVKAYVQDINSCHNIVKFILNFTYL